MASIQTSTEFSRQVGILETNADRGDYDLDGRFDAAITRFMDVVLPNTEGVLQALSATLIDLSFQDGPTSSYRLTLQGSGIGPVSSLKDLETAIEAGLASGGLGNITLSTNGITILTLALAPGGYTLTSGVDVFRLNGSMPTTFAQMVELADLLGQLNTSEIVSMLPAERSAYFNALAAYGLTGFSVATGGTDIWSFAITATGAVLRAGDLTLTLNGEVPDDFGAIASVMYDIFNRFESVGQPVDLTQVPGLSINSLVVTAADGTELSRLTGPITTGFNVTNHTITGTAGNDVIDVLDLPFTNVPGVVVNLLGGNDTAGLNVSRLFNEAVFWNIPLAERMQVTLDGGLGTDTLVVQNYGHSAGVVVDLGAGRIQGFNLGMNPNTAVYTAMITSFEMVVLEGTGHQVLGSAGNDLVQLSSNYWQNFGDLFFAGGAGVDTLDLSGSTGSTNALASFAGLDRATLLANYTISANQSSQTGEIVFDRIGFDYRLPEFRLLDVENLILRTATGTESVSVASLIPTEYHVDAPVFRGTYLNERITGTDGVDAIYGMDGADTLIGNAGDDFLYGGSSAADLRDVIYGGDGNDYIDGGWGNDELLGGNGNDTILGDFGSDTLIGNAGDDLLSGGAGADVLFGGPGNDTLNGGFGFDRLVGGAGADRFFHQGVSSHGTDWILDYNAADGDVLVFGQAGATRAQFQVNIQTTPGTGSADVAEAFVVYRPTSQIMWALVDGAGQDSINILLGGTVFDLLA